MREILSARTASAFLFIASSSTVACADTVVPTLGSVTRTTAASIGNELRFGTPGDPGNNGTNFGTLIITGGLGTQTFTGTLLYGGAAPGYVIGAGSHLVMRPTVSNLSQPYPQQLSKGGDGDLTLGAGTCFSNWNGNILLQDSGRLVIEDARWLTQMSGGKGIKWAPSSDATLSYANSADSVTAATLEIAKNAGVTSTVQRANGAGSLSFVGYLDPTMNGNLRLASESGTAGLSKIDLSFSGGGYGGKLIVDHVRASLGTAFGIGAQGMDLIGAVLQLPTSLTLSTSQAVTYSGGVSLFGTGGNTPGRRTVVTVNGGMSGSGQLTLSNLSLRFGAGSAFAPTGDVFLRNADLAVSSTLTIGAGKQLSTTATSSITGLGSSRVGINVGGTFGGVGQLGLSNVQVNMQAGSTWAYNGRLGLDGSILSLQAGNVQLGALTVDGPSQIRGAGVGSTRVTLLGSLAGNSSSALAVQDADLIVAGGWTFGGDLLLADAALAGLGSPTITVAAGKTISMSGSSITGVGGTMLVALNGALEGTGAMTLDGLDITLGSAGTITSAGTLTLRDTTLRAPNSLLLSSAPLTVIDGTVSLEKATGSTASTAVFGLGALSGAGASQLRLGTGTSTAFAGNSAAFTGSISIGDGAVATLLGTTLGADIRSAGGASSILEGSGTVGSIGGASPFLGTVRPGLLSSTAAQTLSTTGNATFGTGSQLVSKLYESTTTADKLEVGGTATISPAAFAMVYDPRVAGGALIPPAGTTKTFEFVDAGSISGRFSSAVLRSVDPVTGFTTVTTLDQSSANTGVGTSLTFAYTPTTFSATFGDSAPLGPGTTNTSGSVVVQTPNGNRVKPHGVGKQVSNTQINATVNVIRGLGSTPGASVDTQYVATQLLQLPAGVLPGAVVSASVSANPDALPNAIFDSMQQAGSVAMKRLMQLRDGAIGAASAKADAKTGAEAIAAGPASGDGIPINGPTPDEGVRAWGRAYGFYETVDEESLAQGAYTASMAGALFGADVALDGGILAGAFLGVTPGNVDIQGVLAEETDQIMGIDVGLFASWVPERGNVYLQGVALGSFNDVGRTRSTYIPGVVRTATSSSDVWGAMLQGEGGLNLEVADRTWLQPYLGLSIGYMGRGGYQEQGAGSLNLTVGSQDSGMLLPTGGARLLRSWNAGTDVFSVYVGGAFLAQVPLGDWSTTATSEFDAGQTYVFTEGPNDRYGGSFEAGVEFATIKGATIYASFVGAALTGKERFGGQVGVFVPF